MATLAEMTKKNDFVHTKVVDSGKAFNVLRAVCKSCDVFGDVKLKNTGTLEEAAALRLFRGKGWQLGNKRTDDTCPACVKAELQAKRAKREEAKEVAIQDNIPLPDIQDNRPKFGWGADWITAEAESYIVEYIRPYMIERPEKGIVNYIPGWNDQRALTDLKVVYPKITINLLKQVRYKNFGLARIRKKKDESPLSMEKAAALFKGEAPKALPAPRDWKAQPPTIEEARENILAQPDIALKLKGGTDLKDASKDELVDRINKLEQVVAQFATHIANVDTKFEQIKTAVEEYVHQEMDHFEDKVEKQLAVFESKISKQLDPFTNLRHALKAFISEDKPNV